MEGTDRYYVPIETPSTIDTNIFPAGFETTILHQDPYIVKIHNFLTDDEINAVLQLVDTFSRSTIVANDKLVHSTMRTSVTSYVTDNGQYKWYGNNINNLLKKVCCLLECDQHQIEQLMVVKYNEGEHYYNHHDYFENGHNETMGRVGQRIATFFCYLSTIEEGDGGETEFPQIGVKSRPIKGDAVFWWNQLPSGKLLDDTLHRDNPVKKGVKYGLNIWVRKHIW